MGEHTNEIEPIVLDAFRSAIQTTFDQLTQISFELRSVTKDFAPPAPGSHVAFLDLLRPIPSLITLELSSSTLEILSNRLFPATQLTMEMREDALREFLNVIAGQAKTALKGTPFHYQLSLPQTGTPVSLQFSQEAFAIHFDSADGPLVLNLFLPTDGD